MTAILPEEEQEELPTGFTIVGHVGTKLATLTPITAPQKSPSHIQQRTSISAKTTSLTST